MFVDFDGFKFINDFMGYVVGDIVLKEVVDWLWVVVYDVDMVVCIGGDEFVLLMEDVGSVADCVSFVRCFILVVIVLLEVFGWCVVFFCLVGIVVYLDYGVGDKLLYYVDVVMYMVKCVGGGSYVLYEFYMDEGVDE